MRVAWTTPALRQLEDIQDYIARDDPRAAFEVAALIRDRVNGHLPDNPSMGRRGRVAGTRELVISGVPYIVAYRLKDDDIQILAVKHSAQNWPKALSHPDLDPPSAPLSSPDPVSRLAGLHRRTAATCAM